MKKNKFLSILMLVVVLSSMMVACSDDEQEQIDYTSSEIIEILLGSWDVYGSLKVTPNEKQLEPIVDNYKGTIEFKQYSDGYIKCSFWITDNDLDNIPEERFIARGSSKGCCKMLKKEGSPYVQFGSDGDYNMGLFKIVSISKSKLKMVLDGDYKDYDGVEKHVYMTLISE